MSLLYSKYLLGTDKYGRRVTMTQEGDDITIEIEPSSQRDDGEKIQSLSGSLLTEAARILNSQKEDRG
jgi:hypothetical protein